MAKTNTHRAAGRAVSPLAPKVAARTAGGAAVLGSVMLGSAFSMQSATAETAPAAPAPKASTVSQTAAPAAPQTAPASNLSEGKVLHQGERGDRVAGVQKALNANGADLAEDGVFGPLTHQAVINYQASNGLQVDGRVGPETRGALNGGGGSGGSSEGSSESGSSESGSSVSSIVDTARTQSGVPYSWGGQSSSGYDCSGLVGFAYQQHGIDLPRTSGQIAAGGKTISQSEAQPGDIVHWPGHVGIYAGNGKVVDSSPSQGGVAERSIWGSPTYISYR